MRTKLTALFATIPLAFGCASLDVQQRFLCPTLVTDGAYQQTLALVNGPFFVPPQQVRDMCSDRLAVACTSLESDGRASVYVNENVSDRNAAVFHEVCHVYRVRILGIPYEQDANHEGWIRATSR